MQGCDWRLRRSKCEKWDLVAITGECRPSAIKLAMKEIGAGRRTAIDESGNGFT